MAADMAMMRENVKRLVEESAEQIAIAMIGAAKGGQVAAAKYLFEMMGLYPATEETTVKPKEDSVAFTLFKKMGLLAEPGMGEEVEKDAPFPASGSGCGMQGREGGEDTVE
jgi:hypothetical protein